MSLTRAKAVAKDPENCTTEELDDALTTIVESDRLSETQVTNLQNKIDPVLRRRITLKDPLEMGIAAMDRDGIESVGRRVREIIQYGIDHPVAL
jgi:hypothetical protein